jgi:solute carrier family 35, member C2
MLGWFVFSAALSTYNKYVFGVDHMNFQCPLLMTSIHFGLQWAVSHILCQVFPVTFGSERLKGMEWREWCVVSIPCGVVTSGDVGLSNLSLVRITMTFYTMVKSSTPIFVLAWAYLFGIEQITWSLILVVLIIAAGELLTVLGEVDFDHVGFLLCLTASVLSGARWTLVQLKLRSIEPPIKSTIATMKLLSPSMFFSLLAFSLAFEKPWNELQKYDMDDFIKLVVLGVVGGTLAISMVLCEFHLIIHANAFLLMIGGVIKEMVTIMVGISLFGDKLNLVNASGVLVVFLGVFCYKLIHYYDTKKIQHHLVIVGGNDDDDDDDDASSAQVDHETPIRGVINNNNGAGEDGGLLISRRDVKQQHNGIELPKNGLLSTTGSSTHRHREASFS